MGGESSQWKRELLARGGEYLFFPHFWTVHANGQRMNGTPETDERYNGKCHSTSILSSDQSIWYKSLSLRIQSCTPAKLAIASQFLETQTEGMGVLFSGTSRKESYPCLWVGIYKKKSWKQGPCNKGHLIALLQGANTRHYSLPGPCHSMQMQFCMLVYSMYSPCFAGPFTPSLH